MDDHKQRAVKEVVDFFIDVETSRMCQPIGKQFTQYLATVFDVEPSLADVLVSYVDAQGLPKTFARYLMLLVHKARSTDLHDTGYFASSDVHRAWGHHLLFPLSYTAFCMKLCNAVIDRDHENYFDPCRYFITREFFILLYGNADLCLDMRAQQPIAPTTPRPSYSSPPPPQAAPKTNSAQEPLRGAKYINFVFTGQPSTRVLAKLADTPAKWHKIVSEAYRLAPGTFTLSYKDQNYTASDSFEFPAWHDTLSIRVRRV